MSSDLVRAIVRAIVRARRALRLGLPIEPVTIGEHRLWMQCPACDAQGLVARHHVCSWCQGTRTCAPETTARYLEWRRKQEAESKAWRERRATAGPTP